VSTSHTVTATGGGTATATIALSITAVVVDYWAYNTATQACELNPTIIGGTPTYASQSACNAANGL
jgi:hypothetical protein